MYMSLELLERKLKVSNILFDYMQNNLFCTRSNFKINNEIKISNVFPIYLRNPNELEIDEYRDNTFDKIYSLLKCLPCLQRLISMKFYELDEFSCFSSQIFEIQEMYENYKQNNSSEIIDLAIKNDDKKAFALYLSSYINDDSVIIEVKDWKKIDSLISKYMCCSFEDIETYDYREYFIERYINFFNIINFDLTRFKGITILNNNSYYFVYKMKGEYFKEFEHVILNFLPIDKFVENEDDLLFFLFLINNFDEKQFMRERNYSVSFITCLESLLVSKTEDEKSSIKQQLKFKIRKCCSELNYNISGEEIWDLYDYRSLAVHGNFNSIQKCVDSIVKRQWYVNKLDELYDCLGNVPRDNSEKEYLIYCRLYDVFKIVFTLFCKKKKKLIMLKQIVNKSYINKFKF